MRIIWILFLAAFSLIAGPEVKVQIRSDHGARIVSLPLERYVAAVLAGEASVFQSREALKAMAIAARTYGVRMRGRHSSEGFDLCDTTHCQRLDLDAANARFESAAADTAGELLWFEGKPAFTPYTRDCGGQTEDAAALWPDLAAPYLRSRADPYCTRSGASTWQWNADPRQVSDALRASQLRGPRVLERISILDRTASGRASTLALMGGGESIRISASSLRFAVGRDLGWNTLRGDRYEVRASNGRLVFDGAGLGHGAGLCQAGAEQMGLAGRSYREILAFYYPGTSPGLTGRGLPWQRLGGELMALMTTQPDQDRVVLATAERLARTLVERTRWPVPSNVEIRVYPDLDTFRNATGEPGWVAAHTEGRTIHLQPVAVLRSRGALESTLTHELLHVLLESQSAPGLPLWFREGLVGFLENERVIGAPRIPPESDLRQTADAAKARRAYADAAAMVRDLARRYGDAAVLGWVKRGLPSEVTKASASQPAVNSK